MKYSILSRLPFQYDTCKTSQVNNKVAFGNFCRLHGRLSYLRDDMNYGILYVVVWQWKQWQNNNWTDFNILNWPHKFNSSFPIWGDRFTKRRYILSHLSSVYIYLPHPWPGPNSRLDNKEIVGYYLYEKLESFSR